MDNMRLNTYAIPSQHDFLIELCHKLVGLIPPIGPLFLPLVGCTCISLVKIGSAFGFGSLTSPAGHHRYDRLTRKRAEAAGRSP
jgi:hypothetical protein